MIKWFVLRQFSTRYLFSFARHAIAASLSLTLLLGCSWEPARKKQLYGINPEVNVAPSLLEKITDHSTFIEFSESTRRYLFVFQYEIKGSTDCMPLKLLGFTERNAYTVTSDAEMLAGQVKPAIVEAMIDGVNPYINGDTAHSTFSDAPKDPRGLYVGGFRKNFPMFPAQTVKRQKIVGFPVGSIIAKHTLHYYIWSENPECSPQLAPDASTVDSEGD